MYAARHYKKIKERLSVLLDFWKIFGTLNENNAKTNSLEPIKMQKKVIFNFFLQLY